MTSVVINSRVTRILSLGIALATAAAVQAQDKTVTANVPFNFYVGSSAMPQGAYRVAEFGHGSIVYLRSGGAAKSITTHRIAGKTETESAKLVFRCYGESYFLAEIWTGDSSVGEAISVSPREKELARSGTAPTLAVVRLALR